MNKDNNDNLSEIKQELIIQLGAKKAIELLKKLDLLSREQMKMLKKEIEQTINVGESAENIEDYGIVKQFPIQKLNISTSTKHALMRNGLTSVGQIPKFSKDELKCFRGIGEKSVDEIEKVLHELGLNLFEDKCGFKYSLKELHESISEKMETIKQL